MAGKMVGPDLLPSLKVPATKTHIVVPFLPHPCAQQLSPGEGVSHLQAVLESPGILWAGSNRGRIQSAPSPQHHGPLEALPHAEWGTTTCHLTSPVAGSRHQPLERGVISPYSEAQAAEVVFEVAYSSNNGQQLATSDAVAAFSFVKCPAVKRHHPIPFGFGESSLEGLEGRLAILCLHKLPVLL